MANNTFVFYAIAGLGTLFTYVLLSKLAKLIKVLILLTIAACAFGFFLVPIYNVFCDVTGLNGKVDLSIAEGPKGIDKTRNIAVEFVVNNNRDMPWEFRAKNPSLNLHPGQVATTAYYVKNNTKKSMVAQAIPSISPSKTSKYFKKLACFCFDQQRLGPGESAYLTLQFYIDPDVPKDIPRITLSYTLFDVSDKK